MDRTRALIYLLFISTANVCCIAEIGNGLKVKTADCPNAGTNYDLHVCLFDADGKNGGWKNNLPTPDSVRDRMERDSEDIFSLMDYPLNTVPTKICLHLPDSPGPEWTIGPTWSLYSLTVFWDHKDVIYLPPPNGFFCGARRLRPYTADHRMWQTENLVQIAQYYCVSNGSFHEAPVIEYWRCCSGAQCADLGNCDLALADRQPCSGDWAGITEEQCKSRECCYDDSEVEMHHCFRPVFPGEEPKPVIAPVQNCVDAEQKGPCRGNTARFRYNAAVFECQQFSYGGCKPNGNNYDTKEKCENNCLSEARSCESDEMACCSDVRELEHPILYPVIFVPKTKSAALTTGRRALFASARKYATGAQFEAYCFWRPEEKIVLQCRVVQHGPPVWMSMANDEPIRNLYCHGGQTVKINYLDQVDQC